MKFLGSTFNGKEAGEKGEKVQAKIGIMHVYYQTSQYSNSLVDITEL